MFSFILYKPINHPFFANHVGVQYEYTLYVWCSTLVLWVIAAIAPRATWLSYTYIPVDLVIVFMAGFILLVSEACHEMHLRTKFRRYDLLKKTGNKTLSSLVSTDVANILTVVSQRLDDFESLLQVCGSSIWVPVTDANGTTAGYRIEKKSSLVYEAKLLCRALRATSVHPFEKSFMDDVELKEQRFAFFLKCVCSSLP